MTLETTGHVAGAATPHHETMKSSITHKSTQLTELLTIARKAMVLNIGVAGKNIRQKTTYGSRSGTSLKTLPHGTGDVKDTLDILHDDN